MQYRAHIVEVALTLSEFDVLAHIYIHLFITYSQTGMYATPLAEHSPETTKIFAITNFSKPHLGVYKFYEVKMSCFVKF